jgi:hypothetical protein
MYIGWFAEWIDKMFDGGIGSYRASYMFSHPWLLVDAGWTEVRYAWQRVFRGWDDRVWWDINGHISHYMPQWIETLRKNTCGHPVTSEFDGMSVDDAHDKWCKILKEMEDGFRALDNIESGDYLSKYALGEIALGDSKMLEEEKKLNEKGDRALELFVKWFRNLWD